jgi:hypothetical protein
MDKCPLCPEYALSWGCGVQIHIVSNMIEENEYY